MSDVIGEKQKFEVGNYVVCPTHGLGKIVEMVEENIFNNIIKLYIIEIQSRDIVLRIPVNKVEDSNIRHINKASVMKDIIEYLSAPYEQNKKVMWNKRHLLYEENVNSSDLFKVLSVIKDLYHSKNKIDEQVMTFSEKSIYKTALDKVVNEISLILNISREESEKIIFDALKNEKS